MHIEKFYNLEKNIKSLASITIEGKLFNLDSNNKYHLMYDLETILKHSYYKGDTEEYSKDIIKRNSSKNPWINKTDTYSKLFKIKSKDSEILYNYIPAGTLGIVTRIGKAIKQISGIDTGDIVLLNEHKIAIQNPTVDINTYKKEDAKFKTTINDQSIFMVIKQKKRK